MNEQVSITAKDALAIARSIAMQVKLGNLSYKDGKEKASQYIEVINTNMAEIAKKYGKKPSKINWSGLLR